MKIERRTFLKMLGAAVVAPSLPIPQTYLTDEQYWKKSYFENRAISRDESLSREEKIAKLNELWEEQREERDRRMETFMANIGVWDGVTFINT